MADDPQKILPVLKARPADLAARALVVGDPDRAAAAAELLDDAQEVGHFREFWTFSGSYQGTPVTIASHGVGGAGASVCFEELFQGGVNTIIRAGTCGAMKAGIKDGELIIGTGAIREDGTSPGLLPLAYPAIADRRVTAALIEAAQAQGYAEPHEGIVLTKAFFYEGLLPSSVGQWLQSGANVVCVEMEFATLLVIASLRGARAGGLFTSDGNLAKGSDPLAYDPHRTVVKQGVATMLKVALSALARLD
jgi:uridine phosphorylase